jgi:putative endonuclease
LVSSSSSAKGQRSEQTAAEFLQREGYRILARNYRHRSGEIDIIAEEKGVICFVEVRSSRSSVCGDPLETVNLRKQRRIARTAGGYLGQYDLGDREARFDVVGITYEPELRIRLVRNAFEASSTW